MLTSIDGVMCMFSLFISIWICLDLTTGDRYLALYDGHTETYRHVRVVFTGREGAGKTTVCRRLQNKHVNIKSRKPTVGAEIHPDWFWIDWGSKEWELNDDKSAREVMETRMGVVMKKSPATREAGLLTDTVLESRGSAVESPISSPQRRRMDSEQIKESTAIHLASQGISSEVAFLSLWDMGGHASFQASHNVFISSHGVYLLIFRLTDFLKDKMETDRLKKWIRMIGTFSSVAYNALKYKLHHPPLIFVGTFLDELKKASPDYNREVEKIRSSISKFPELSSHKLFRFCTVDNSQGTKPTLLTLFQYLKTRVQCPSSPLPSRNADRKELRSLIIEFAEKQDQWGRQLPTRWLKLEMDLLKAREEGTKILTLKKVIEMNNKSIAPLADEDEIKLALEYLHCTRSVIYFREFDYVINDPQWLADCFSLLITDDQFLPYDDLLLTRDMDLYKTKGELTPELINGLLSLEKNEAFRPHQSLLLALMEKFGLIVRIRISEATTANVRFSETYTIPSKLMELQNISAITDDVIDLQQRKIAVSNTLCLVFPDVFVPEELFHRIYAMFMRTYRAASISTRSSEGALGSNLATTNDATCLYRGFGCFEVNDRCRMILSMHWERSTIAVTLFNSTYSEIPPDSGSHVRTGLEKILKETLQMSSQQHFRYEYKLHCNFHLSRYDTPVELYSVIHANVGMPCKGEECRGKHRLMISDLWFWGITEADTPLQKAGSNSAPEETCLNRRPTPKELGRLSYIVEAPKREQLFIGLGLSIPDIKNVEHEARNLAVVTQSTKMFLTWTYSYPNLTFCDIEKAMKGADMDTDSLVTAVETGLESVTLDDMESNQGLNRPLVVSEISHLVNSIGKGYFNLFLELGLSVSAIEKCEMNNRTVEDIMETLIKFWIHTFRDQATVVRIVKAMKVCKMNWNQIATTFKQ